MYVVFFILMSQFTATPQQFTEAATLKQVTGCPVLLKSKHQQKQRGPEMHTAGTQTETSERRVSLKAFVHVQERERKRH